MSLAENIIAIQARFLAFCPIHAQSGLTNEIAFDEWQNEARGHFCEDHAETNTNSFSLCHNGKRIIDRLAKYLETDHIDLTVVAGMDNGIVIFFLTSELMDLCFSHAVLSGKSEAF